MNQIKDEGFVLDIIYPSGLTDIWRKTRASLSHVFHHIEYPDPLISYCSCYKLWFYGELVLI